jgi:hypothetical protein
MVGTRVESIEEFELEDFENFDDYESPIFGSRERPHESTKLLLLWLSTDWMSN